MFMSESENIITAKELQSKGGKARASKLSPERRKEIASLAGSSKKNSKFYPKATHSGELKIGNNLISCAVLPDGTAIINQSSIQKAIGRSSAGGGHGRKPKAIIELEKEVGGRIPMFLAISNLIPFMSNYLRSGGDPIEYIHPKLGKSKGFNALIIPEICEAYLKAKDYGALTDVQLKIANNADVIMRGLARIGIQGLVYEATGFERDKESEMLQQLFNTFIAKELQPWTKKFPNEFFDNIKRMYGLEHLKGNPKFAGHLINRYIYNEISSDVLDELKKQNPITEQGYRRHCHHQLLTNDIGHPALEKQILKINTLMSVCDSKDEFEILFDKSKR